MGFGQALVLAFAQNSARESHSRRPVNSTNRANPAQDGPVIMVGHAHGGMVITEAGNDLKIIGLVSHSFSQTSVPVDRTCRFAERFAGIEYDPGGGVPTVEQTLKKRRLRNAYAPAIHRVTYGAAIAIICNVQCEIARK